MTEFTLAWANSLTIEWVAANVDHEAAARNDSLPCNCPPSSYQSPFNGEIPPLGSWRADQFGEYEVLIDLPVAAFEPSEQDWDWALQHWSTKLYIEWLRAGLRPPPLTVVENREGELRASNRRRWLAARAAGVESLWCWYSPFNTEHCARSRWWLPERSPYHLERYAFALKRSAELGRPLSDWIDSYVLERIQRHQAAVVAAV